MERAKFDKVYRVGKVETIYRCLAGTLGLLNIENWEHNRPPDMERVREIAEEISSRKCLDGIIYLAEDDGGGRYVCYDGNHRRIALELSGLTEIPILVSIMRGADKNTIVRKFCSLNKANPVPELYMSSKSADGERETLEEIVEIISARFKKFLSSSRSPRSPNFNRDRLIDQLYRYFHSKPIPPIPTILEALERLNEKYEQGIHIDLSRYSDKVLTKCRSGRCFLFLKDFTYDLEF